MFLFYNPDKSVHEAVKNIFEDVIIIFEVVINIFDHLENRFSREEKKKNTCTFFKNSRSCKQFPFKGKIYVIGVYIVGA